VVSQVNACIPIIILLNIGKGLLSWFSTNLVVVLMTACREFIDCSVDTNMART